MPDSLTKSVKVIITTEGGQQATLTLKGLEGDVEKVIGKIGTFSQVQKENASTTMLSTGVQRNMGFAVMEMGNTLQDAGMMATNFRMGIMGVTARLQGLVFMLQQVRAYGDTNLSMWGLLKQSMTGMGGVLMAVSAVAAAVQIIPALFDHTGEKAKSLEVKFDDLTKTTNKLDDGFIKVKDDIDKISFEELSQKYDDLILSINESNAKLKEESTAGIFGLIRMGLGLQFPWQDFFPAPSKETKETAEQKERAKKDIEDIGEKIKYFLNAGYTTKSLLNISPSDRDKINKYLKDILDGWAENIDRKDLSIGNKLRGSFVELGTFNREQIKNLSQTIDELKTKRDTTEDELNKMKALYSAGLLSASEYYDYLNKNIEHLSTLGTRASREQLNLLKTLESEKESEFGREIKLTKDLALEYEKLQTLLDSGNVDLRERYSIQQKILAIQKEMLNYQYKGAYAAAGEEGSDARKLQLNERTHQEILKIHEKAKDTKTETEEIKKESLQWNKALEQVAHSFSSGLAQAIINGRSLNDILKNILSTMIEMVAEAYIYQALMAFLGGITGGAAAIATPAIPLPASSLSLIGGTGNLPLAGLSKAVQGGISRTSESGIINYLDKIMTRLENLQWTTKAKGEDLLFVTERTKARRDNLKY